MEKETKFEVIQRRRSIRTYDKAAIKSEDVDYIRRLIHEQEACKGPLGTGSYFHFEPVSNHITTEGEKIGTYGVIKNPSGYIVAITKNKKNALIDLGYLFEDIIIKLTEKQIGTCWLGGTFNKTAFENKFDMRGESIIPVVTPVGYYSERVRLFENAMRKMINADSRKPWADLFFKDHFANSLKEEDVPALRDAFEAVRLGPSASNKQPWRILYHPESNSLDFILEHTPNYGGGRLDFDMQLIDIGIAMYHFESVANEGGLKGEWLVVENPQFELVSEHQDYICTYRLY